jgi:hypothetical protein
MVRLAKVVVLQERAKKDFGKIGQGTSFLLTTLTIYNTFTYDNSFLLKM